MSKPRTDITEALSEITFRSRTYSFEERPSDASFIETVWRTPMVKEPTIDFLRSGPFTFPATCHWGLIVARHEGRTKLTVWGPGTRAAPAPCPGETELIGIMFRPGVFMPHLPLGLIRDRRDMTLPEASGKSFWLNGGAFQFPDYENADTFVNRLVQYGILVRDNMVDEVLQGGRNEVSPRSAQRRFLQATGLTQNTIRQMERAQFARRLLMRGVSILDTVAQTGYYDQAHLPRSLKRFVGLTPAQITRTSRATS